MPDSKAQQECFSLANMIPQVPENNRGVWENIEKSVRNMATTHTFDIDVKSYRQAIEG